MVNSSMAQGTCTMQDNMHTAYICLGSNMGNSEAILSLALQNIESREGLCIAARSPLYRTEPQGYKEQNWFFNQVIRLQCQASWTATMLMDFLLQVEKKLGRQREHPKGQEAAQRNGPRPVDLDILLFDQEISSNTHCALPHPRMFQRAFVLLPLLTVIEEHALTFLPQCQGQSSDYVKNCLTKLTYSLNGDKIYQS